MVGEVSDFDGAAESYSARAPYLPEFFQKVVEWAPLTGESIVVDLACGSGELAVGFAPRCKSVIGIDISSRMISLCKTRPENVSFKIANPNVDSVIIDPPADLVTIGRSIRFFDRARLLSFLKHGTVRRAGVVVCGASIGHRSPWYGSLWRQCERYVEGPPVIGRDLLGVSHFQNTRWLLAGEVKVFGRVKCTLDDLLNNALSYSRARRNILEHRETFVREMRFILEPYFDEEGYVDTEIVTWGFLYRRAY